MPYTCIQFQPLNRLSPPSPLSSNNALLRQAKAAIAPWPFSRTKTKCLHGVLGSLSYCKRHCVTAAYHCPPWWLRYQNHHQVIYPPLISSMGSPKPLFGVCGHRFWRMLITTILPNASRWMMSVLTFLKVIIPIPLLNSTHWHPIHSKRLQLIRYEYILFRAEPIEVWPNGHCNIMILSTSQIGLRYRASKYSR